MAWPVESIAERRKPFTVFRRWTGAITIDFNQEHLAETDSCSSYAPIADRLCTHSHCDDAPRLRVVSKLDWSLCGCQHFLLLCIHVCRYDDPLPG